MDITCCDMEVAVIARNILLLTLILDDSNGESNRDNWNIYYHLYLDQACHTRLRSQAKKLHGLSSSMKAWRASEYSKLIRFCDQGTLRRVGEVWNFYFFESGKDRQANLETAIKTAIQRRNEITAGMGKSNLSARRSVDPVNTASLEDLSELHTHFWEYGRLELDEVKLSQAVYANPMFVPPNTATSLHWGTDPLLGFHLSAAYCPLTDGSPPSRQGGRKTSLPHVVEFVHTEFATWSNSFRDRAIGKLTLRFFTGEALAFSHALQHRSATGGFGHAGSAPYTFTVIDTSNLIDHAGALNLLTATSPLLAEDTAASLYTEILVRQTESHQELADSLLFGHLPTISLLLGLFPADYWTNTSPVSIFDEFINGYCRPVTWKRSPHPQPHPPRPLSRVQPLRMDEDSLTEVLFQELFVYMHLFGVFSVDTLRKEVYNPGASSDAQDSLLAWKDLPSTVSVTLKVLRENVAIFIDEDSTNVGTVPVLCSLENSRTSTMRPWLN
ncbi:Uu.00g027770.m01.CDS01, partial [Anthostomella pinea]